MPQEMFHWGNTDNNPNLHDHNPTILSKSDDHSPFFSNFPSPFFDEHELPLHQILRNQCTPPADPTAHNSSSPDLPQKETINNGASSKSAADRHVVPPKRRAPGVVPRRRPGKKDRHSKICTAQGIRDRRMRLSLQVARKFFDLQDMLGYDKASKTIEWLFNKSKKAIKDLIQEKNYYNNNINISISDDKSESLMSDCEVLSGIDDTTPSCVDRNFQKKPGKESREKARARARCRTREKKMLNSNRNSGPNEELGPELGHDVGTIEKLLGVSDPNSNFMGFLGNWDLMNNQLLAGNSFSIYSETSAPDFLLFNHQ